MELGGVEVIQLEFSLMSTNLLEFRKVWANKYQKSGYSQVAESFERLSIRHRSSEYVVIFSLYGFSYSF